VATQGEGDEADYWGNFILENGEQDTRKRLFNPVCIVFYLCIPHLFYEIFNSSECTVSDDGTVGN
jgi:hypothetical protein